MNVFDPVVLFSRHLLTVDRNDMLYNARLFCRTPIHRLNGSAELEKWEGKKMLEDGCPAATLACYLHLSSIVEAH